MQLHRKIQDDIVLIFDHAFPRDLNLFHSVYIERGTPVFLSKQNPQKTKNEIGFQFQISGDLKGFAYCFLDLFEKNLSPDKTTEIKSIFKESMNILLGNTLTSLEEHNLLSLISAPKEDINFQEIDSHKVYYTHYNLTFEQSNYPIRVFWSLRG